MTVLIDNYDSFTYNLVQKLGEVDPARPIRVFRNDKVTVAEVEDLRPTHVVVSPGPCTPREGGVSNDVIRYFGPRLPGRGVCLGPRGRGGRRGDRRLPRLRPAAAGARRLPRAPVHRVLRGGRGRAGGQADARQDRP